MKILDFKNYYFKICLAVFEYFNLIPFSLTDLIFGICSQFQNQYYCINLIEYLNKIIKEKQQSFKIKKCFDGQVC